MLHNTPILIVIITGVFKKRKRTDVCITYENVIKSQRFVKMCITGAFVYYTIYLYIRKKINTT